MALFGSKTATAEKVAAQLTQVVTDTFQAGIRDQDDLEWMTGNRSIAAKIFRYYAAVSWFWADVHIMETKISKPAPDVFMQLWRHETFSTVKAMDASPSSVDDKVLWSQLFDDIDEYRRIFATRMESKAAAALTLGAGVDWFKEVQGVDIFKAHRDQKSALMTLSLAAEIPPAIDAVLKNGCR